MNSPALTHMMLNYVECDVPAGQTLVDWRRELDAERRAQRRVRRNRLRYFQRPRAFRWTS